jgi:hypothetical protein
VAVVSVPAVAVAVTVVGADAPAVPVNKNSLQLLAVLVSFFCVHVIAVLLLVIVQAVTTALSPAIATTQIKSPVAQEIVFDVIADDTPTACPLKSVV